MSRLTRDGTAEPVSRDQILRHARGQGNDHEQDWQPYPVDPYSPTGICDDHTYIHIQHGLVYSTLMVLYTVLGLVPSHKKDFSVY